MRTTVILGLVIVLAGCGGVPYSNPYASPDFSQRAECERSGGYWHSSPAVCESPLYRW